MCEQDLGHPFAEPEHASHDSRPLAPMAVPAGATGMTPPRGAGVSAPLQVGAVARAAAAAAAGTRTPAPAVGASLPRAGSRRTRLWELAPHVHCPVLGVCLPIEALRRLDERVQGRASDVSDYELHCGVISECRRRGAMAETLQRELDRRYAAALRPWARLKSVDELRCAWRDAVEADDVAAALWSVLTHPRCTPALEQDVLAEVHMLQHQLGVGRRADLARLSALEADNHRLQAELAGLRERMARQAAEQAKRIERLQQEAIRLRADMIGRDTLVAALREDQLALEASVPDLRARRELAREVEALAERNLQLQRELQQNRLVVRERRVVPLHLASETPDPRPPSSASAAPPPGSPAAHAVPPMGLVQVLGAAAPPASADDACGVGLDRRSVLCVGGRSGSVPVYRRLIEQHGGSFVHHDGGEEDGPSRLDAALAAADLVICQTGCISHDAYWRVKDHCRRTGKRCVFVASPSGTGLQRALVALGDDDGSAS